MFLGAVSHNAFIVVLSLAIQIPFALGLALMLNRRFRGRAILRLIFFAPYVIAEVITAIVWSLILQPNGLADHLLTAIGLGDAYQPWLADPDTVLVALFFIITWKYFGFHMILLLAGLQGIPREVEEAAAIDGASRWQAIRYVTLPLLGPTHPGLGVPVDHRIAAAVRPRLGHDPRRAGERLEHDGGLHVRPGLRALPVRLRERRRRDPVPHLLRPGARLPALGHAARHGRSHHVWLSRRPRREAVAVADRRAGAADARVRVRRARGRPSCATPCCSRSPRSSSSRSLYAALGGFRDAPQLAADPVGLPDPWVWTNYTDSLTSASFWIQLRNSAVVAGLSTVVVVLFAALAAFVLARREFPGREVAYTVFTLGLLFPATVAILPLLILVRDLGLLDNPLGLALPEAAFGLPLTIIILRPFFRSIPKELEDAAAIDGCGPLGLLLPHPAAARRGRPWSPSRCSPSCRAGTSSCCRW